MKNKLQEYALIAEIIGGIGIIASLVFVGAQVSQNAEETALNTRQLQAAAFSELTNSLNEINRMLIENPDNLDVWLKVRNGEELTPRELELFNAFVRMFSQLSELAWQQYENGIISEENLRQAIIPLRFNLANSDFFREIYDTGTVRSVRFVQYINSLPSMNSDEYQEELNRVPRVKQ